MPRQENTKLRYLRIYAEPKVGGSINENAARSGNHSHKVKIQSCLNGLNDDQIKIKNPIDIISYKPNGSTVTFLLVSCKKEKLNKAKVALEERFPGVIIKLGHPVENKKRSFDEYDEEGQDKVKQPPIKKQKTMLKSPQAYSSSNILNKISSKNESDKEKNHYVCASVSHQKKEKLEPYLSQELKDYDVKITVKYRYFDEGQLNHQAKPLTLFCNTMPQKIWHGCDVYIEDCSKQEALDIKDILINSNALNNNIVATVEKQEQGGLIFKT